MKTKTLFGIPFATILLASSLFTTASAQVSLGVAGAAAFRWGTIGKFESLGGGYNIEARYVIKNRLAVGANYRFVTFGPEKPLASNVKYNLYYTNYSVSAEYYIIKYNKGKFRPYVGADFGRYNFYTLTTIDLGKPIGKISQKLNKDYFGFAPVIGLSYRVFKRLDIYVTNRYDFVFIEKGAPIGYTSLNLGVKYDLWKGKKQ